MKARSEKFDVVGEIVAMYGVDEYGDEQRVDDIDDAVWVYIKDHSKGTTVPLNTKHDEVRVAK